MQNTLSLKLIRLQNEKDIPTNWSFLLKKALIETESIYEVRDVINGNFMKSK